MWPGQRLLGFWETQGSVFLCSLLGKRRPHPKATPNCHRSSELTCPQLLSHSLGGGPLSLITAGGVKTQRGSQSRQLSLQRLNPHTSRQGQPQPFSPTSQPSLQVGTPSATSPSASFFLPPPHSTEAAASALRPSSCSTAEPRDDPRGSVMGQSISFHSLNRNQVCSLNRGFR